MEEEKIYALELLEHALSVTLGEKLSDEKFIEEVETRWAAIIVDKNREYIYGGCESTVSFMRFIRAALKEVNLLPKTPLSDEVLESLSDGNIEAYYEFRKNLLGNKPNDNDKEYLGKKGFGELFQRSRDFEMNHVDKNGNKKTYNEGYNIDGWYYGAISDVDMKEEWLAYGKDSVISFDRTHYYYNELDHYITYLVGAIKKGINNKKYRTIEEIPDKHKECGITVIQAEIEEKFKALETSDKNKIITLER